MENLQIAKHDMDIAALVVTHEKQHLRDAFEKHSAEIATLVAQRELASERHAAEIEGLKTRVESLTNMSESVIPTLRVKLEWYRYESDIYVDGYVTDPNCPATDYEITSANLLITWLGILAHQAKPLRSLDALYSNPHTLRASVSTITMEQEEMKPQQAFCDAFDTARSEALGMIPDFIAQASRLTRYRDIPTTIDREVLIDLEARVLIREHCQMYDPNFKLKEVELVSHL